MKPTSVRNMVGVYNLSSFPWCSGEPLLEMVVSTLTDDKNFLEDLDLFRSERYSVAMFLAPLPDFPCPDFCCLQCRKVGEPGIFSLISMA